jgi:hypothetical protein
MHGEGHDACVQVLLSAPGGIDANIQDRQVHSRLLSPHQLQFDAVFVFAPCLAGGGQKRTLTIVLRCERPAAGMA